MYDDSARIKILKALSDESRLKMIRILYMAHRAMTCGELCDQIGIANTTISYHLRTLREAGLTTREKKAQSRYISVREETFNKYLPGFLESLTVEA